MSHNTNEQLPSPRSSGQQSGAARAAPKRWAVAALLLTLALGQVAQAVDGQLDPSFGGNGLVTLDIDNLGDQLFGVAILSDGRIAVGGFTGLTGTTGESLSGDLDFVVGAFSGVNGSLDPGFGTGGLTITDIIGPQPVPNDANALVLQNDGKIVLVGRSGPNESPRFAAVRYRADGQPDTGFGVGGIVETPFPGPGSPESNARDVAVQTDGKIILAGVVGSNVLGSPPRAGDIALVRYNQDGSLDDGGPLDTTSGDQFGLDGTVRTTHLAPIILRLLLPWLCSSTVRLLREEKWIQSLRILSSVTLSSCGITKTAVWMTAVPTTTASMTAVSLTVPPVTNSATMAR